MKTDTLYTTQHPDTLCNIALNLLATEDQNLALTQRILELKPAREDSW